MNYYMRLKNVKAAAAATPATSPLIDPSRKYKLGLCIKAQTNHPKKWHNLIRLSCKLNIVVERFPRCHKRLLKLH